MPRPEIYTFSASLSSFTTGGRLAAGCGCLARCSCCLPTGRLCCAEWKILCLTTTLTITLAKLFLAVRFHHKSLRGLQISCGGEGWAARKLGARPRREMASTRRGGFRGKVEAGAEIVCRVQHALQDLIVVTFLGPDNKLFHGVLLDSTKRNNSPFGIYPPGGFSGMLLQDNPRHNGMATMMESAEDSYPQLSRRHTYYQDTTEKAPLRLPSGKSDSSFPSHAQDKRLKVRLRARQVLCSKCSSICNESGENVQENSKREKGGQHGSSILLPSKSVRGLQIIRPVTKRLVVDLKKDRVLSACSSKLLSRSKPQSSVKYFGVKKHKRNFNGGGFNSRTLQTFKDPEHEARSKHLAKRNILVPN